MPPAGLVFLLHLLLGPDDPDRNPAPGALYVLLWVGLVPASLLLGPVWRLVNPLRALHALHPPRNPRPLPAAVGIRPAAVGLLLFTWLELVAPDNTSSVTLLTALAVHCGVQLAGAARHGERWFAHADPFEVYSSLLARLSPLGRRADGRLVLRSPSTASTPPRRPPVSSPPSASSSAPPPTTVSPTTPAGSPPSRPPHSAPPPPPHSASSPPSPSPPPATDSARAPCA